MISTRDYERDGTFTPDGQTIISAGGDGLLVEVPLMRDDVHDVDRLVALERWLLG